MISNPKEKDYRLYIGKLSNDIKVDDLERRFSTYGRVKDLVFTSRNTEVNRNFVHLTLCTDESGLAKCQTDYSGSRWGGARIKVTLAHANFMKRLLSERDNRIKSNLSTKNFSPTKKFKRSNRFIIVKNKFPAQAKDVINFKNWKVSTTNVPVTLFRTRLPSNTAKVITIDPTKFRNKHKRFRPSYEDDRLNHSRKLECSTFTLRDSRNKSSSYQNVHINSDNVAANAKKEKLNVSNVKKIDVKSIPISNSEQRIVLEDNKDTPSVSVKQNTSKNTKIIAPSQDLKRTKTQLNDTSTKKGKKTLINHHTRVPKTDLREMVFDLDNDLVNMNVFVEDRNANPPGVLKRTSPDLFYVKEEGLSEKSDTNEHINNNEKPSKKMKSNRDNGPSNTHHIEDIRNENPSSADINTNGIKYSGLKLNIENELDNPSIPSLNGDLKTEKKGSQVSQVLTSDSKFTPGFIKLPDDDVEFDLDTDQIDCMDIKLNIKTEGGESNTDLNNCLKEIKGNLTTELPLNETSSSYCVDINTLKHDGTHNNSNDIKHSSESSHSNAHTAFISLEANDKNIHKSDYQVTPPNVTKCSVSSPSSMEREFKCTINTAPAEIFNLDLNPKSSRKVFRFNFSKVSDSENKQNVTFINENLEKENILKEKSLDIPEKVNDFSKSETLLENNEPFVPQLNRMFFFHVDNDALRNRSIYDPKLTFKAEEDVEYPRLLKELSEVRPKLYLACKRRNIAARKGKLKWG